MYIFITTVFIRLTINLILSPFCQVYIIFNKTLFYYGSVLLISRICVCPKKDKEKELLDENLFCLLQLLYFIAPQITCSLTASGQPFRLQTIPPTPTNPHTMYHPAANTLYQCKWHSEFFVFSGSLYLLVHMDCRPTSCLLRLLTSYVLITGSVGTVLAQT